MSELSDEYRRIMNEVDNKITDKDQLEFVKNKMSEMSIIFIDLIDKISDVLNDKIANIEESQSNIEKKLEKIQNVINIIEKDVYDDDYEIEIVCPYCNNEFMAEVDDEDENEVECPECHNIIELDLNSNIEEDDNYYFGNCSSCGGCKFKKDDDDEEDL